MNENEIIGAAELLKNDMNITEYDQYHDELINIILLADNMVQRTCNHMGVINICLELLSELLKSRNNKFRNAISGYTLKKTNAELRLVQFLLENFCSKFLYNKSDGSLRADVQVSIQSNVLTLIVALSGISVSDVVHNNILMTSVIKFCNHTDFLIREKGIICISELINNAVHNEQNKRLIKLLAMVFIPFYYFSYYLSYIIV